MINKRIIFALLYSEGNFYLSRNFRLQKVGDINWIEENYKFHQTCEYLDELAFILVTKNPDKKEKNNFYKDIEIVRKKIFSPIIIGGGIRNLEDVKKSFNNGADKILINTKMQDHEFIKSISEIYGNQAISIIVDYKFNKITKEYDVFFECGTKKSSMKIKEIIKILVNQNFGELILHSMDNDGTGNGFDIDLIKDLDVLPNKPILLMGGAGKPEHIINSLNNNKVSGVITANIFNFIGESFKTTRELALKKGIKIAKLK